jgi:uncharacterized protein
MHDIQHDRDAQQFHTTVDGQRCELDYRLAEGVMTITHTGVPEAVGGRGIAGRLVEAAFGAAREAGWKVRPSCAYAAAWATRHPDVGDLLA